VSLTFQVAWFKSGTKAEEREVHGSERKGWRRSGGKGSYAPKEHPNKERLKTKEIWQKTRRAR